MWARGRNRGGNFRRLINNKMAQKQTRRAERGIESLVCTFEDCKELQGEEMEFCEEHYQ